MKRKFIVVFSLVLSFFTLTVVPCAEETDQDCSVCQAESKIVLGKRPAAVQAAVDEAFQALEQETKWGVDGNHGFYSYYLFGLIEKKLIENLANDDTLDEIYLMDVGCSKGAWGQKAKNYILEYCQSHEHIKKHFHIFSVTGGIECSECICTDKNVTLYQFNRFKIENICEEFANRGYDLKNRVNLIVASWTLRHLVDPWGTVKQMYNLLLPRDGLLVATGFFFAYSDSDKLCSFPQDCKSQDFDIIRGTVDVPALNWNILNATSAIPLFRYFDDLRDLDNFLLMRSNTNELDIPLEYTGDVVRIGGRGFVAGNAVTVFKKGCIQPAKPFWFKSLMPADHESRRVFEACIKAKGIHYCLEEGMPERGGPMGYRWEYYCDGANEASKKLYAYLVAKNLLCKTSADYQAYKS